LQRFKIDVASTVVNQQNAALGSMETDQLLDLFNVATDGAEAPPAVGTDKAGVAVNEDDAVDATGEVRVGGQRHAMDDMAALWDEKQYEEEYDLNSFLANMKA
jgi:TATA-binding protein-associated factor